jgi:hypothetical protein
MRIAYGTCGRYTFAAPFFAERVSAVDYFGFTMTGTNTMYKLAGAILISAVFAGAVGAADAPSKPVPPKPPAPQASPVPPPPSKGAPSSPEAPASQSSQPKGGPNSAEPPADDFSKQYGALKSHPDITKDEAEEKKSLDDFNAESKKADEAFQVMLQKKQNKSASTKQILTKAGYGSSSDFAETCQYATDMYDLATLYRDKAVHMLSIYPAVKSKVSKQKPQGQPNPNDSDYRMTRFMEQQYRNICAAALEQARQAYIVADRSRTNVCKVDRKAVDCAR